MVQAAIQSGAAPPHCKTQARMGLQGKATVWSAVLLRRFG